MFRSRSAEFNQNQVGCCTAILKLLQYCGLCRNRGYTTGFLEDRAEGQPQNRSTQYQAPSPSASTSNFYTERSSPERAALLPKATELHNGGQSSSTSLRPLPHLTEPDKRDKTTGEGETSTALGLQSLEQLAAPPKASLKDGKDSNGVGTKPKQYSNLSLAALEDEDICSTCLDGYSPENPKIWTKCGHHYHLACIYEWLERKQTCPLCETAMSFEELA
eukprot:jgi/Botrbrau1/4984/Bobra.0396s0011.1